MSRKTGERWGTPRGLSRQHHDAAFASSAWP
jgi:hypothetical protein